MAKRLEHLSWKPMWVSHLGCIKGCLDFLDIEVSDAWLYGGTGHAFIINLHEEVCPSGPTAWHTEMLFKLGRNVGYEIDGVFARKNMPTFPEAQQKAWEHARRSIDAGVPCYGWELDIPEYYVVNGYDEIGYHYVGPSQESAKKPKPWQELGATDIGVVEMYSVKPGRPADDAVVVKQAFEFALEHAQSPEKWIFPKYQAGLAGYDNWIGALQANKAHSHGMAYNVQVWCECRSLGVAFLKEAKDRLDKKLGLVFDEAIAHYDIVARNLKRVEELFPFHTRKPEHIADEKRCHKAAQYLRVARTAEAAGLEVLKRIVAAL